MADKTLIAWTDHTFNPWMGCHKVSAGCKNCYAETLVKNRMGKPDLWGATGIRQRTKQPWKNVAKWNREAAMTGKPAMVFVASLADVFEDYPGPNEWRPELWDLIAESPWLDFQLLTKRPENIARMLPADWGTRFAHLGVDFYPNVWLGTSIEDSQVLHRAQTLAAIPAVVHFISYEPAIGPFAERTQDEFQMDRLPQAGIRALEGIEWLICGGESGPGHRKLDLSWAYNVQDMCDIAGTAFFFKQNSGHRTELGIDALGDIYRAYPKSWGGKAIDYQRPPHESIKQPKQPKLAPSTI